MVPFIKMVPPGILQKMGPDTNLIDQWTVYTLNDDERRESFMRKYPHLKPIDYVRYLPYDFGRLIAKIAYGYAITKIDIGDIDAICVPYILGTKTNISYIVGDDTENSYAKFPHLNHQFSIEGDFNEETGRLLIIVKVRLFSNSNVPTYKVVVGQVCGHASATRFIKNADWEEEV